VPTCTWYVLLTACHFGSSSIQQIAPQSAPLRSIAPDTLRCFRHLIFYPASFRRSDFTSRLPDLRHGSYRSRNVGAYDGPILVRMGRSLGRPVRKDINANWRQATANQAHCLHPSEERHAGPHFTNRPTNPRAIPTRVGIDTFVPPSCSFIIFPTTRRSSQDHNTRQ
jgi:hypothetical protein